MPKDITRAEYFDVYKPLLTEKQCSVMEMYYDSDLSLSEISEQTNITRQAVFNCIRNCEAKLDKLENALHLLKKNEELKSDLSKLAGHLKKGSTDKAEKLLEKMQKKLF